ncbi:hypothetical protein J6590_055182 [Homalodisca vitripennis]|nr:hypothetical protein J6590_055182 [Homalodisca vitripennis]
MYDMIAERNMCMNWRPRCHLGCHVTCAAFHPTLPFLFVGCSKGAFLGYHVNKGLHQIVDVRDYNSAITSLAFSCDGSYFAVTSMSSRVSVYNTNDCQLVFASKLGGPARALAWHPWKRSCLVAADVMGSMALYNVLAPSGQPERLYTSIYNSAILCVSFNPLSAELVVSHRIFSEFNSTDSVAQTSTFAETQLNVLASFDRVVDRMHGHTGRVPFLNWSPDGTKLASSGSDETARIWNFLPHEKNQKSRKKSCKLNYPSAAIELGNRMGLTIR